MSRIECETVQCRVCRKAVGKVLCKDEICERYRLKHEKQKEKAEN